LESFAPLYQEARELLSRGSSFEQTTDGYRVELTTEGSVKLLAWRLPQPIPVKPEVLNPSATVTSELGHGTVTEYEIHCRELVRMGEVERNVDRKAVVKITPDLHAHFSVPTETEAKLW